MKPKISRYTPYLLTALIITMTIRFFFDPLQLPTETYTLWDIKNNTVVTMDINALQVMTMGKTMSAIVYFLCPIISEMLDWIKYSYGIMDGRLSIVISSEIMMTGYVVFIYFLEKFHSYWHDEESHFAICLDMLCLENIASYILSLVFYFTRQVLIHSNMSEYLLFFIAVLIGIPCLWISLFYFSYLIVNFGITLMIPLSVGYFLETCLSPSIALIITGIFILFTTQIIWRLCSDKIFSKLIGTFSFHHLNLD